mmetsp:Transcript_7561/g.17157  ORF Transcript_7561/g.17157 Transcript_7561/m.17157 type:complete len:937 (+) Transcript_7561:61-2871(+)
MMGNSTSHHRHYLYWGAVFLLMIPSNVHGWNIPYFGGDGPTANTDDLGVRVDSTPPPFPASKPKGPANIPLLSTVAAPLIGPVDAPHLRYIPSYFSNQIPPNIKQLFPTILSTFQTARSKVFQFLWYKPPVGIVGAWSFLRLLEKLYGVISPPPPTSGEEALADAEGKLRVTIKALIPSDVSSKLSPWGNIGKVYSANIHNQQILKRRRKRRSKVRKGRSFDLDGGDRSYANFGGIETVRVRACQEGLQAVLAVHASNLAVASEIESSSLAENGSNNVNKGSSLFGVKRNSGNGNGVLDGNTMAEYAKDMKSALGALQLSCPPKGSREFFVEQSSEALSALSKYITPTTSKSKDSVASIHEQNINLLLHYSSKLIELRTLDALLRTLRDRHLIVSARLRRTRNYWKWHVNLSGGRLGRLVQTLRQQAMSVFPALMGDDFRDRNQREYELATATWERELEWLGKVERLLLERPAEMEVGDLLAVVGNKKQKPISLWNNLVNSEEGNDVSSKSTMSESIQFLLRSKNRMWVRQTEEWNKMARETIKDSLIGISGELGESGKEQDETEKSNLHAESRFLRKWATHDNSTSDTYSWLTVLSLVEVAASPTRAGERRHFQLSGLTTRVKRYDFLGIPSSALLLAAANSLHDNVIAPHKQEIVEFVKSIFNAIWGIIKFRFYTPMKDIALDLLNRRPRMVDPFALLNEQTSLDNMLMDLGVGDGTKQTRAAALTAASRMYEQEVAGGALRGIFRGKVAQLMLIQIQQLKADLLQAMDQIDNLVDANRLNVQLLASIPAVLILIFGTRALFLFWSNIRMKDFRLPHDVHADMSDYLKKIEECLVLSNYQMDASVSTTTAQKIEAPIARAEACLKPKEMGQVLLLLHAYLNLLDYMSPPFPSKQCDSIHQSMQNLFMQGQMSTSRQLELLKVIQSKHADLLKSL